jgi:hypothetical protein
MTQFLLAIISADIGSACACGWPIPRLDTIGNAYFAAVLHCQPVTIFTTVVSLRSLPHNRALSCSCSLQSLPRYCPLSCSLQSLPRYCPLSCSLQSLPRYCPLSCSLQSLLAACGRFPTRTLGMSSRELVLHFVRGWLCAFALLC